MFLLVPLSLVFLNGISGLGQVPGVVYKAAGISVVIALISTGLTIILALALARTGEIWGYLGLAISPMVIGTGLFLLINPVMNPNALALPTTALVNALMALPFAVRVLAPQMRAIEADYGRLADALGLRGWARMRWIILPRLRKPLGFSAGLAAALSMGDLGGCGVVCLAGLGHVAASDVSFDGGGLSDGGGGGGGGGLILLVLSLVLFWIFDRGGRVDVDA